MMAGMSGFPWSRSDPSAGPNAIVGAAKRVRLDDKSEIQRLRERGLSVEQELAWRYYDKIGEIKTAYNYFAAIASRVRLQVGYETEVGTVPMPIGEVGHLSRSLVTASRQELARLSQGRGGQPNFLRSSVLNLLVPGECYLIGENNSYDIRSTSEVIFEPDDRIRIQPSRHERRLGDYHYLEPGSFMARIWRTHPQYSDDPDSALLGMLEDCSDLLQTARLIRASGKSRMNAGLLYVADELRFQRSSDPIDPATPQPDVDPFEEELTLSLTEPIGETDSPAEVMPLLVRGPSELIDKGFKHIDLSRQIQEVDIKRFEQLIKRIRDNLDVPADLITGLANVRYSNARTISEDFLKAYVEPIILIICEALTTVYLRPMLLARGFDAQFVKNVHVWYDPSEIVTRPDRSEDADKGYDKMLVGGRTWRRAHGFSEFDAPDALEIARRISLSGGVPESTTVDFLRVIAPKLIAQAEELARESFGDPNRQTPPSQLTPAGPDAGPSTSPTTPEPPEGNLEPGVVGRPPADGSPVAGQPLAVSSERLDRSQMLELVRSLTAAAAAPSDLVQDRTRRLERALEVERRLRESMYVQLNDTVQRALERAGARTVSKTVRKDAELRAVLAVVPLEEAYSAVPAERLEEFGLTDPSVLIRDTIERSRDRYVELVRRAQDQGWLALGGHVLDTQRVAQLENLEKSWDWLADRLTNLATNFLRKPKRRGSYVSYDIVRDAATLAGGGRHEVGGTDVARSHIADSGRAVLGGSTLDATGWTFGERMRWVYGVSDAPFEPHVRLDDVIFDSWTARELASANPDAWPYQSHYAPGDHDGCQCDWLPEVLDEPVSEILPDAVAASGG